MKLLNNASIFILASFAILASACEELVDPPLDSASPVLVVDAWLTDQPGGTKIRLTTSAPFNSQQPAPLVTDAQVTISGPNGDLTDCRHQGSGIYAPESPNFAGLPGGRYLLCIVRGQVLYTAESRMPNAVSVDSLTYIRREQVPFFTDGYYPVIHFRDLANVRNFYFLRVFRNQEMASKRNILLLSDENLDGGYLNYELDFHIALDQANPQDELSVAVFSLSEGGYNYHTGLRALVETGSPAQAVPDNPPTNLRGGALGYFCAASVDTVRVRIVQ